MLSAGIKVSARYYSNSVEGNLLDLAGRGSHAKLLGGAFTESSNTVRNCSVEIGKDTTDRENKKTKDQKPYKVRKLIQLWCDTPCRGTQDINDTANYARDSQIVYSLQVKGCY